MGLFAVQDVGDHAVAADHLRGQQVRVDQAVSGDDRPHPRVLVQAAAPVWVEAGGDHCDVE